MPRSSDTDKVYVFVCKGDSCSKKGRPERLRVYLKQMAREFPAGSLKVSYVSCLGMCGEGPNILVCKGGNAFDHCTEEAVDAIEECVRTHVEPAD